MCVGVGVFCSFRHDMRKYRRTLRGDFCPLANLVPEGVFSLQKPRLKMLTPTPNAWRAPPVMFVGLQKRIGPPLQKPIYTHITWGAPWLLCLWGPETIS